MGRWLISCLAVLLAMSSVSRGQFILNNNDQNDDRDSARRAAVQAAQGQVDSATLILQASIKRVRTTWKAEPEYAAAEKNLNAQQAAYDKAKADVRAKLANDADYKSALAAVAESNDQVKAAQAENAAANPPPAAAKALPPSAIAGSPATRPAGAAIPPPPSSEQVAAAEKKLQQKSGLRDIEDKAYAADPNVQQAKANLDAASERMTSLKAQLDAALQNDPEYKGALTQVANAKAQLTAAAAQR